MSRLPFDADAIRQLAGILTETGLTEIEVADGDHRIRVARTASVAAAVPDAAFAALQPGPAARAPSPPAAAAPADYSGHPGAITSPMVGIAYLTPEPGAPPFAAIGQAVSAGQTILLIEAMKTFNQIKATRAGTLAAIMVASGSPVEFGEVLAVIE